LKQGREWENYLLAVIRGEQNGWLPSLVLGVLALLEQVYRLVLSVSLAVNKRRSLPVPVISVGNLTVGGTGKTPLIVWLARELQAAGFKTAILTRGYGGQLEKEGQVLTAGAWTTADPKVTGDEPLLLAKLLPEVVIAIGRDRYQMGLKVLATHPAPDLFLLDDGFQYWRLQRQLDLVLLDAEAPFANGRLLPRGLLREPPAALKRAQVVLLTRTARVSGEALSKLTALIKKYQPHALVGEVQAANSTLTPLTEWGSEAGHTWDAGSYLAGRRIALVTAIGNPGQLRYSLQTMGAKIVYYRVYPDHHVWDGAEVAEIITNLKLNRLTDLVVTGKDGVKLLAFTAELQANGVTCYILNLEFKLADPEIRALIKRVASKGELEDIEGFRSNSGAVSVEPVAGETVDADRR
jgi:tetraacyldisaccharide 4'-kinase